MENLLNCPSCKKPNLETIVFEGVEIEKCNECRGLWFDKGELDGFVQCKTEEITISPFEQENPLEVEVANGLDQIGSRVGPADIDCPKCEVPIDTYRFNEKVDLEIDVCGTCQGFWLNSGELEHVQHMQDHLDGIDSMSGKTNWGQWAFQFLFRLPVEFNVKPRRMPIVTYSLIFLCVLLHLAFSTGGFSKSILNSIIDVNAFPAMEMFTLAYVPNYLTYIFFHGSFFHLLGNMYFLYILGDNIEDVLGRKRYLALFLLLGAVSALGFAFWRGETETIMIGASGAIAGIMAMYMVFFRYSKLTVMLFVFQFKLPIYFYFGFWFLMNIFSMYMNLGHVAWSAHVAGFLAGLAVAFSLDSYVLKNNPLVKLLRDQSKVKERADPRVMAKLARYV